MPDDDTTDTIHHVIDLGEYRAKMAERAAPQPDDDQDFKTLIRATADGKVKLRIGYTGGVTETLIAAPETAEWLGRALLKATRKARAVTAPKCTECGKPWCGVWHVGLRVEGWHRGRKVVAYVARITTKGSVRLEPIDGGPAFYSSASRSWPVVGHGRLTPV